MVSAEVSWRLVSEGVRLFPGEVVLLLRRTCVSERHFFLTWGISEAQQEVEGAALLGKAGGGRCWMDFVNTRGFWVFVFD